MPLLPLEPFIYPDCILEVPSVPGPGRWWVLHTKPRTEKSLARRLLKRGISFFLPTYHRQWRAGGQLRSSYLPLFPGYFFLYGDGQDRCHAIETNMVAHALSVFDQDQLHADLSRVYQLIQSGTPLSPEERLKPGTPVEIISGPLAGLEGKILRRGKHLRFFVEVTLLQQGVAVEIETWMFRPLGRTSVAS